MGRAAIILLLCAVCGCKSNRVAGPASSPAPGRTFRMGFSGDPPRLDFNIAVASINMWLQRADAAIVSGEIPWDSLLAGTPPESVVVRQQLTLVQYYKSHGAALWVYLDPANGLNRGADADALVRRGLSLTDTAIQRIYRRYAVVEDSILRPDHLGLALETNLIRAVSSPALYDAVRAAANGAARDVRARDPSVNLSVSVQADVAWGLLGGGYQGVEADFADFPFIQELGISSYPYLAHYKAPEDIPPDYYARLAGGRMMPEMVTEGGWTSAPVDSEASTPALQQRYIVSQARLLDASRAIAVFQLTFTDIDLSGYPQQYQAALAPFAFLGLVDVNLNPKPALQAWDSLYAVPRTP